MLNLRLCQFGSYELLDGSETKRSRKTRLSPSPHVVYPILALFALALLFPLYWIHLNIVASARQSALLNCPASMQAQSSGATLADRMQPVLGQEKRFHRDPLYFNRSSEATDAAWKKLGGSKFSLLLSRSS